MLDKKQIQASCLNATGALMMFGTDRKSMREMESFLKEYIRQEVELGIEEYFGTTSGRETVLLCMNKIRGRQKWDCF